MSLVDPETNTTKRGPKKKTVKTASLDAVYSLPLWLERLVKL